jgi:protein O-mannosyl-transferase
VPRRLLPAAALLAVIFLSYFNSFSAGFVLDNKPILLQDPRIQAADSANLSDIFRHTYWWPTGESGLYRPLTTLSYLFNYSVLENRDQPAGYHWINLLLHCVNAILLYYLLLRLTGNLPVAAASAALWAIHPVLTEAVTNMVGRADLLAALSLLAGLLLYLKYCDAAGRRRIVYLAGLALATTFGLFCKESAAVLIGLIALIEFTWWRDRGTQRARILPAALAVLIPLGIFLYCRSVVLASSATADFPYFDNPITGADFWTGRLTALKILARYIAIILWPASLSADYSYNQIPLATGTVADWLAWIVIAALAAGIVASYRKNSIVFFLGCFAFLTILPSSNLLFATGTMMAERLAYLPAAAVVACFVIAVRQLPGKRAAFVIICLTATALGSRTLLRNEDWQTDLTLARATVAASPHSFKSHQMLAEALFLADPQHRDIDAVLAEARQGIAILDTLPAERSSPELYRLAGACYLLKNDAAGALPVLQHGVAILTALQTRKPGPTRNDDLYRLLSAAELRAGNPEQALANAMEARKRDPLNPDVYTQLAKALERTGDPHRAASTLMLGMLVTSDMGLRKQLIDLYRAGLDQQHCAVIQGPAGPAINPACDLVRTQLCEVSSEAVAISLNAGRTAAARSLQNSFTRDYACPAR